MGAAVGVRTVWAASANVARRGDPKAIDRWGGGFIEAATPAASRRDRDVRRAEELALARVAWLHLGADDALVVLVRRHLLDGHV